MDDFKVGDIVARRSYDCDILFKIIDIKEDDKENEKEKEKVFTLQGLAFRIEVDAFESDLVLQSESDIEKYNEIICSEIQKKTGVNV